MSEMIAHQLVVLIGRGGYGPGGGYGPDGGG